MKIKRHRMKTKPDPDELGPLKVSSDPFGDVLAKVPSGRKTKYKEEFVEVARSLCQMGATDHELAEAFGCHTWTIWYWQNRHPEFGKALKAGKELADDRVERSLYQRAVGYTFDSEEIKTVSCGANMGSEVERVPVKRHVAPDTTAQIFWLKNRRRGQWRDVHKLEHTGPDGDPIEVRNVREELIDKIAEIGQRINGKDKPHHVRGNGKGGNGQDPEG